MRTLNKKILKIVKIILWGLVYTLPLWQLLISTRVDNTQTLYAVMSQYVANNNFVAKVIYDVFGATSTINMFPANCGIVEYFAYFVYVSFAHICVDVVLFLPDCARYIFDKMTGEKDEDTI